MPAGIMLSKWSSEAERRWCALWSEAAAVESGRWCSVRKRVWTDWVL